MLQYFTMDHAHMLLAASLVIALTSVPLALRWVPPNPYYGFRTRFTRSDRQVWYDANAFVGRGMLLASLVSAAVLYGRPFSLDDGWMPAAVLLFPVMLVLFAGFAYLRHLRESMERR